MIDIIDKNYDWELRKETLKRKTFYRFSSWKKGMENEEFNGGDVRCTNTSDEMADELIKLSKKINKKLC